MAHSGSAVQASRTIRPVGGKRGAVIADLFSSHNNPPAGIAVQAAHSGSAVVASLLELAASQPKAAPGGDSNNGSA